MKDMHTPLRSGKWCMMVLAQVRRQLLATCPMSQNWAVVKVTPESRLVWVQKLVLFLQVGLSPVREWGRAGIGLSSILPQLFQL